MANVPESVPKRPTFRALETSDAFFDENERQVTLSLLAFLRDPFVGEARESLNRIEASRRPRGRLRPVR